MITIDKGKRTHHHAGTRISMFVLFMNLPKHYGITQMIARRYSRMYAKC